MMAGTDALTPPVQSTRDWTSVSINALSLIFAKLDAFDVLMGAGLVCHSWLQAAKVPDLWRSVDMVRNMAIKGKFRCRERDALYTVDRSSGQLEVFMGEWLVDDDLLKYIGDRSPSLKSLQLISCPDVCNKGFADAIKKFPLLEELELSRCWEVCEKDVFETVGKTCPQLKHFKLNKLGVRHDGGRTWMTPCELHALASRHCLFGHNKHSQSEYMIDFHGNYMSVVLMMILTLRTNHFSEDGVCEDEVVKMLSIAPDGAMEFLVQGMYVLFVMF